MSNEQSEVLPITTRLTVRVFRRLAPMNARAERVGDWLSRPEDIEGVAARIASIALAFGSAVVFSLTLCTLAYGLNLLVGR